MNRIVAITCAALGLVGLLAVAGLVWPVLSGYPGRIVDETPVPFDRSRLHADLAAQGLRLGNEAFVRIFKREHRLEVFVRQDGGRFVLFRGYDICTYSGGLGPKLEEGDRQAPEGFYRVAHAQLNPNSRHHLAFNIGFPNAFDRSLDRTGSFLMVHGGCSSIGCYAMTDAQIDEIYAITEAALAGGQQQVDVAIFPFRMTETALSAEAGSQWAPFWRNLKQGFDLFEVEGVPPEVAACNGLYVFGTAARADGCMPISGWV